MENNIAAASVFLTRRLVEKMEKLRYFRLAEIEAALYDYISVVFSITHTSSQLKGFQRFIEIYKAGLTNDSDLKEEELHALVLDGVKTLCTEIVLFG